MSNVPSTSLAAYKQAQEGLIQSHEKKIVKALEVLKIANYDQIALYLEMEPVAVNRRLAVMRKDKKVFRLKTKSMTRKGREAFDYELITFRDHAANLLNLVQKEIFAQE